MNTFFYSLLFFCCCCSTLLLGQQQPSTLSLQEQLSSCANDSTRCALLLSLYRQFPRNQSDTIIQLATRGVALGQQHLDKPWGREAYRISKATIGHAYRRVGKFHFARRAFQQLIAQGQTLKDSTLISDGYSDLAYVFSEQEKEDSTILYDLKALAIRKAIGSPKIGSSYNNLGYDYKITGQLKKGLFYYQQAITYKLQEGMEHSLGNTYMNVGNIYQKLEVWDSALYYLDLALHHVQASEDSLFRAEALHNIGKTHLEAGQTTTANHYLEQAMFVFQALQMQEHPRMLMTYQELARAKLALQDYQQATALLAKANILLTSSGRSVSHQMKYQLQIQADLAWASNNYQQARQYTAQKEALLDSLHQRTLQQKTYQLLTDYENELKLERIKSLEQQQQINQLKYKQINRQCLILAGLLLLLVLVIVFLYRVNQWRSKVNEELSTLNASKDKLFSIIAHDLKNPLSAFRSITQSLSDDIFDISREDLDYFIQRLNHSAHHLFDLLQNLLYWSITQSGRLEFQPIALPLQENMQEVIDLLHNNATLKNITIQNNLAPTTIAWADAKMTQAILRNLLANAVKFTPNKGTVQISSAFSGNTVQIAVQDTGKGVPPEIAQHVFSLTTGHQRTTDTGTGLGLVLCKELVEHQGGKIWLEQSSSKGSTFCFTLPIFKTQSK
ncbi:MAG: ATP-binding protein [Aureispira sp.]